MTLSRTCIISREKKQRSELLKITRVNNYYYIDEEQKLHGRSFYLDPHAKDLKKIKKQQRRFNMSDENFAEIIKYLEEKFGI